jgi:AmmeMemoRadiSam system protein B
LPNKNVKILPILTGSPSEYIGDNTAPDSNEEYNNTVTAIKDAIDTTGKKVLILSSGDLSHVGRKFGDDFPAATEQIRIKGEDQMLIEKLTSADKNAFFTEIAEMADKNRICGTAPFYSALSLTEADSVTTAGYNQWHEEETESMVSFAGFIVV